MSSLEQQVVNEAMITGELVSSIKTKADSETLIDEMSKRVGGETGHRITVIAPDGRVIGDSLENTEHMENHLHRPEIQAALRAGRGTSQRFSSTVDMEMYYVAMLLESEDEGIGFVRIAVPLSFIKENISELRIILVTGLLLALFISSVLSLRFSGRITRPLKEVGQVARGIASGDFSRRVKYNGKDELGVLAGTINEMGEKLEENVDQVVYEKNRLETVVSAMTSGVILFNDQGEVDFVNDAVALLFNLTKEEVTGKPLNVAFRNYLLYDQFQAALIGKEIRSFDLNLFFPDTRVLQVHMIPIRDHATAKAIGVLAVLHDITGIRSLERMRSEFAANVSHELRTPLTTIKGYAETLLDETTWDDRETLLHFLKIIDKEAERLSRILNDLLNLSQIESHKGVMKKQKVFVNHVLTEAVMLLHKQAADKNLDVKLETGEKGYSIEGDPDWLLQLFIDLLDNGIKYTPDGGNITLTLEEQGNECVVAVKDNGIGISASDLPYIFERFYRADKARSRRLGGTGLGLAVVKHIVEAHNARIEVKSTPGEGSTFILYFQVWKA